ncbi:MAG: hypothetical protein RLZZ568_1589 [Cyanobacteriota bacterium]
MKQIAFGNRQHFSPHPMDKAQLRHYFLNQRQQLSPQQWQHKSQQLCQQLQHWDLFQQAQTVCAYFSHQQEVDLGPLLTLPKVWGFPRCVQKQLVWSTWQRPDPLITDKYGILTPTSQAPQLEPAQVDLILIPTLAGDRQGYRLGYGGGYYDRLFAHPQWQQIPRLGIVFAAALVDRLPVDPWDMPLSGFCSEQGYVWRENWQKKSPPAGGG